MFEHQNIKHIIDKFLTCDNSNLVRKLGPKQLQMAYAEPHLAKLNMLLAHLDNQLDMQMAYAESFKELRNTHYLNLWKSLVRKLGHEQLQRFWTDGA